LRRAFDFLVRAQYPNGGWPQFYPNPEGYHRHITYNDDAMAGVLTLLKAIADQGPYYSFVDQVRRDKAEDAIKRGVECILKTQIVVNGKRTVWCAQHDEVTFAPADARSYEKASFSGLESAGIVRFLMSLDHPGDELVDSIQSAIAWFESKKIWASASSDGLTRSFQMASISSSSMTQVQNRYGRVFMSWARGARYSVAEME
jgi:pectinesterase